MKTFTKVKNFTKKHVKALVTGCASTAVALCPAAYGLVASAAETPAASGDYTALEDAMTNSMSSTSNSMISVIGKILPFVLIVVGAILVITLGIRLFKKFGKG